MSPCLQIEHLSKAFGDRVLFDDVNFSVAEGQKVAVVARNGFGKTTLLNIIAGKEEADAGTVTMRCDIRVGYLMQDPPLNNELTVLQACMENAPQETELDKVWDYETRYKQILGKLQISRLEQRVATLSGGQRKRVALAAVLIADPDLIILDEPTNHLDLGMVEWLEDFLRRSNKSLLMVTHDRYFLDRVCSDIIELDNQTLYIYHGNYSYYLEKRAERIEVFNAETARAQNLYRTELDWMRRMPQARGHKASARIEAFYDLEERAKQRFDDGVIHIENRGVYVGSKIFEARYICKSYKREGNQPLVIMKDFYYNFSRYEKLGIVGNNGTGKSTFLKMLLGEEKPDSGSFDIGQTVRFGYFSQAGLPPADGKHVLDVIRDIAEDIDLGGGRRLTASQFLQHFLFSPLQQRDYVEKLSGGEKQRLNLCRVLMSNPNFLILDEPTNDLDIQTLNILEDYLRLFKGCLIVVSHDRYFTDKVVDHLLVFKGNGVIKDFPGNYTRYREVEEAISEEKERQTTNVLQKEKPRLTESKRRRTFKEQQELKNLETILPQLEEEKTLIEAQLSNGSLTDHQQLEQLAARYAELKVLIDENEMRWLELSEI